MKKNLQKMKRAVTFVVRKMSFHNLSISVLKVGRQVMVNAVAAAFCMSVFFTSCIPEEDPIAPPPLGDLRTRGIALGAEYDAQVFYSIDKDSSISTNSKFAWDLAFDCSDNGNLVVFNQAKFMEGWQTNFTDLTQVTDTMGFERNKRTDASNRSNDSLVIGDVSKNGKNRVFIVFMGYDQHGDPLGYKKLKINLLANRRFLLEYAELDNSNKKTVEIQRDTNYNWTFYSITTHQTAKVEPPKREWDLAFTQYVFQFYNPYQSYLVSGVLLNKHNTWATVDSTTYDFYTINRETALNMTLSNQPDVIGYNWKVFSNGVYKINPLLKYVIKTQSGYFYKFRFTSFYDNRGVKGTPQFEFRRL